MDDAIAPFLRFVGSFHHFPKARYVAAELRIDPFAQTELGDKRIVAGRRAHELGR